MVNSRDKGARYERELAGKFREYGYDARRGQQYSGANGDADVVGLPGLHIEAKRREKMQLYDWMAQSVRDARPGELPVVMHRASHCETLVTLRLPDFMQLYSEYAAGNLLKGANENGHEAVHREYDP
jgi:hypothetical protein